MNILLGVCGSISAYKSFDILRSLVKEGHLVKVVCTKGAAQFVIPQVFQFLGAQEVYSSIDDFNYPKNEQTNNQGNVLHIELAKWADKILIAPLSANTLATIAHGMSNDLLSSIILACSTKTPLILFPAMNTNMFEHPITKENIDLVQKLDRLPFVFFHKPASGILACGDIGEGKLPDVQTIVDYSQAIGLPNKNKKNIMITAGATISPLDPVRYLTNASTGLTGVELAIYALRNGHKVHMIAGMNASKRLDSLKEVPGYKLDRVTTTQEMSDIVLKNSDQFDIYISAAAINDIDFVSSDHKLKKDEMKNHLDICQTTDILKEVINKKQAHQKIIGFAAETLLTTEVLAKKFSNKPVDLLVGTKVHNGLSMKKNDTKEREGFANSSAQYTFFEKDAIIFEGILSKKILAEKIIKRAMDD